MELRNPKFLAVSALCGALGVLSGYAIYLTYRQVTHAEEPHARLRFALTLLITAVISYAIEWIREVIREGRIEQATHPIFRTVGTFVIVLMFELFVTGFHTTSDLSPQSLAKAANQLLAKPDTDTSSNWTLLFAAGLWIVVGALLAAWLTRSVNDEAGTARHRIYVATRNGVIGGLIIAPLIMALYILGGRCLVALLKTFHDYGGGASNGNYINPLSNLWHNIWLSQNRDITAWLPKLIVFCVMLPFGTLVMAAQENIWLFMTIFLAMLTFAASYPAWRKKSPVLRKPALRIILGILWIICVVYTLGPFGIALFHVAAQLAHLGPLTTLFHIVEVAAVIWAIPGALLGGLTPLLRRVAAHTRNWAFVGYGSAALLVVATLLAHAWWPLIPAVAALAVGYLFQRGSSVYEYWPFAALCVAAGVCGATSITQHITFAGEVAELHSIDILQPAAAQTPAVAGIFRDYDQLSPTERAKFNVSTITDIAIVRGDDGNIKMVPLRILDDEKLKQMQQLMQRYAPQLIQEFEERQAQTEQQVAKIQAEQMKEVASLPPSPLIRAAIDRMNRPENSPPRAKAKPAPERDKPHDDIATINDMFAQMQAESPDGFKESKPAAKPKTKSGVPAVTVSPSPVASKTVETIEIPATSPGEPMPIATIPAAPSRTASTSPEVFTSFPAKESAPPEDPAKAAQDAAKALELSLAGSVGFWVSVGLLACWSMQENENSETHEA